MRVSHTSELHGKFLLTNMHSSTAILVKAQSLSLRAIFKESMQRRASWPTNGDHAMKIDCVPTTIRCSAT